MFASAAVGLANAMEAIPPQPRDLVFQGEFEKSQQREAWSQANFAQRRFDE
jgi:hypothetical protein